MTQSKRDTSRDGLGNRLQTYFLTHFKPCWRLAEGIGPLRRWVNKWLVNSAILKVPTRPYPFSTLAPYTSWESLTTRSWSSRHLPPDAEFNREENLPRLDLNDWPPDHRDFKKNPLAVLFHKKDGQTIYSEKSTLLFPYWVQWFTDSFLRTDQDQRLKNTSNHNIDLCNVYGLNRKTGILLRSGSGGKLKSQILNGEEYPLFFYESTHEDPRRDVIKPEFVGLYTPLRQEKAMTTPARRARMFAMGVERGNVQIGYVMFNVLWFREHNRLCDILGKAYGAQWREEFKTLPQWKGSVPEWKIVHPDWNEPSADWIDSHPAWREDPDKYVDERIYQTARNIMTLMIMKIVVEEYINHITPFHFNLFVDPPSFTQAKWYRENWMPQEFSLVYRWHSALPDKFQYGGRTVAMTDSLWNNDTVIDKGLGALFEETSSQPAAKIGFFNTPDFLIPVELMSIGLAREAQMRSYNDYRELCGFPRVTAFNQITGNKDTQDKLRELYGHVDKIEFYAGLFAEDVRANSALPALIGRLVGIDAFSQAFTNPMLSHLVYNEKTFTPIGWDIARQTTSLSDIVHRNIPQKDRKYKVTFYRDA